jgi:hypothetical protein
VVPNVTAQAAHPHRPPAPPTCTAHPPRTRLKGPTTRGAGRDGGVRETWRDEESSGVDHL